MSSTLDEEKGEEPRRLLAEQAAAEIASAVVNGTSTNAAKTNTTNPFLSPTSVTITDEALEKALRAPGDDDASSVRMKVIRTLERYLQRVERTEFLPRLKQLRVDAIEYAKEQRSIGAWDAESDGQLLQDIIRTSQIRERVLAKTAGTGKVLEPPELTKMLRDDPSQHTCDVKMCCKMMLGWSCVFVFCHVPWIVAIFLIGASYRAPARRQDDEAAQSACFDVAQYLLGFFVIYCLNIVVGLGVAVARNVDEGKNYCVKISPYVTSLISIVIVGYNLYGIIVVWDNSLWDAIQTPECENVRALAVAVLAFFLVLPLLCFSILQLLGPRKQEDVDTAEVTTTMATTTTPPGADGAQRNNSTGNRKSRDQ